MASTEHWVFKKEGKYFRHSENDGARMLRRGLEERDVEISAEEYIAGLEREIVRLHEVIQRIQSIQLYTKQKN
jgi:hypothetical protein